MGKNSFVVLLAVVAGAAAGYYARGGAARGPETAVTLVARFDIKAGTALTQDLLETRDLPRVYLQQDSFEVGSMSDVKLAEGYVALVDIPKGNQVGRSCLKAPAHGASAEAVAPAQQRYLEGIKYLQNGNYEKSGKEFEAALKLDPKHAEAKAGLKRIKQITAGN